MMFLMDFMVDIQVKPPLQRISYEDRILVAGSCFTEHIGGRLATYKFNVLQNPNGILFDPLSVCSSINSYIDKQLYSYDDLFYLNELWHSWRHHSHFAGMNAEEVLTGINKSQTDAHQFLKTAGWLIITLGSAFTYHLNETGEPVANCHRAPAQWFLKRLTEIDKISKELSACIERLTAFNPALKIVLTISPVRHMRDGLIENNRSKARLLEAVHGVIEKFDNVFYFPAYELVIDVLRDYRFYDIDLVHPNYAATEFVFEKFTETYLSPDASSTMEEVKKIVAAFRHRPFQPATNAHREFMKTYLKKIQHFQQQNPRIDCSAELRHFGGEM